MLTIAAGVFHYWRGLGLISQISQRGPGIGQGLLRYHDVNIPEGPEPGLGVQTVCKLRTLQQDGRNAVPGQCFNYLFGLPAEEERQTCPRKIIVSE